MNAHGVTGPTSPIVLAPGLTGTYTVSGIVTGPGPAALVAHAYAETGDVNDEATNAAVFLAATLDVPVMSPLAMLLMAAALLSVGVFLVKRGT